MNEQFDSFGEKFGKGILRIAGDDIKMKSRFDEDLFQDAFCQYVFHHQSFSLRKFFPNEHLRNPTQQRNHSIIEWKIL